MIGVLSNMEVSDHSGPGHLFINGKQILIAGADGLEDGMELDSPKAFLSNSSNLGHRVFHVGQNCAKPEDRPVVGDGDQKVVRWNHSFGSLGHAKSAYRLDPASGHVPFQVLEGEIPG